LVSLVAFSDNAETLSPLSGNYSSILSLISGLRPSRETNILQALKKSGATFSRSGVGVVRHVIIISDGVPTTHDGEVSIGAMDRTIEGELKKMRRLGITVSVICIRDELEENDERTARKIAEMGHGAFSLVNADLLMDRVLGDYSATVMQSLNG
jgi:Mg-chelatase subunit ChlD